MEDGGDGGVVQDTSTDHDEQQEGTYVRDDGKTVRKVMKSSTGSYVSEGSDSLPGDGEIYVRADGKKVRRVKRGTKKIDQGVPPAMEEQSAADLPPKVPESSLPAPMFPGDPPEELFVTGLVNKTPLISLGDLEPQTLVPPSKVTDSPDQPPPSADTTVEEPPVALDAIVASSNIPVLVPEPLFPEPPAPRLTTTETPKSMDTAPIAATHNNIDPLTNQDIEKNPWTSVPSFEESVNSRFQNVQAINPFEITEEPQVFLVPMDLVSPPEPPETFLDEPTPADMDHMNSPSSQESFDPVTTIVASAASALRLVTTPSRESTTAAPALSRTEKEQFHSDDRSLPTSRIETPIRSNTRPFQSPPTSTLPATSPISNSSRASSAPPARRDEQDEGSSLWQPGSYSSDLEDPAPSHQGKFRLPESITAKTRSRADVDSYDVRSVASYDRPSRSLHQMTDADAMVLNATLAHKRVKVVQLLFFGLLGILLAFLGSFYVQSTCHFANSSVVVGANSEIFVLHYGLWKYTPIDSVFQGYSYCANYDDEYTNDTPLIPRIAGVGGIIAGTFALVVLWFYLITGRASYKFWNWAIAMAALAGVNQGFTFLFFIGSVCERNTCSLGPGGWVGIVSAVAWFLVSFEMYYNKPISVMMTHIDPGRHGVSVMSNLQLSDFADGASAYIGRVSSNSADPVPTLNEYQRRRDGASLVGKGMMELNSIKRSGSYLPPVLD